MVKRKNSQMTKNTKKIIAGVIVAILVLIGGFLYIQGKNQLASKKSKMAYSAINVKEGTISSTTLLSGTVKALSEEYIYFDQSRGSDAQVTVKVGDKVSKGQQLVQYNTTSAQAAYDSANRNLNKIGRQINYLQTYGRPTASPQLPENSSQGTSGAVDNSGQNSNQETNASYNQQLQDLNDAYADAQAEVTKAQQALNQTVVTSSHDGTVVEVNNDVDPSAKNSQTLVHVVSEGQLQVKGNLTEYDLATIKPEQKVKIKSKVYNDKTWDGKISYISNYPNDKNSASNELSQGATTSSAASYEYKVEITSPLEQLKQGFSVSVEVVNEVKHILVPIRAIFKQEGKQYVWTYDKSSSKVTKTEVTLGNADAKNQEILTGLKVDQLVISNPNGHIKNGEKLENVKFKVNSKGANSKESEVSQ
ncbi:efflux RND transporter periplasmic adaptor subunit [Streptococcus porcinus]|uniref:Efflux transporter, RND family, MFP subunit n=2 Tax=Streptococcus porcinus TaxID=1340 RepID=A0A4V0H9A2_STRPO|nr:efflux RND transporter periplasmic adaptor subunit [Streptococcus porcinus]EGJ26703.1 efflux transporter, RND family, MFP subunit [Streptococcus porcinus str. Jelinkova 176]SQG44445.1 efflux transporter, RND family, MFP subunit [Streptococcus porcinus]VTT44347.1 efflux transporter, RND family, MFP subunit [Streptococcus porcinus]VTT45614.1 efflux transporter, RND family, MFP subunit [Streptococcus porcinus]